jgi:hypothetical protein
VKPFRRAGDLSSSTDYLENTPMPKWMLNANSEDLVQKVSDHRIGWDPDEWRTVFSKPEWETLRPRFETVESWSVDGCIDRSTLLEAATTIDPDDALTLHIGAMVWGVGSTKGRNRANAAKGLKDANATTKMSQLLRAMRGSGFSIEIFGRIANKGDLGLPGLGSSFATKTLYFMGFRLGGPSDLRPLILDMMVARGLRETAPSFPGYPGFNRRWYASYARLAQRWGDELGFPGRPDVVEYLLFRHATKQ